MSRKRRVKSVSRRGETLPDTDREAPPPSAAKAPDLVQGDGVASSFDLPRLRSPYAG